MSTYRGNRNLGAIVLIGLGVLFLLAQFFNFNVWGIFGMVADFGWPFFIILPGVALLAVGVFGPKSAAPALIPGAVVTGTGLILFFQDATGRFETWAYLWGLYPVFVGMAIMVLGMRTGNQRQADSGRKLMMIGLVLTVAFGVFMEMIFSGGFDTLMRFALPIALIGGGAFLMLRPRRAEVTMDEKAKNEPVYAAPMYADKPKNGTKYGISPSLERQIDDALAEDDPDEPRTTV